MGAEAYTTSKQGVESQFATNHLGPFLFTNLMLREGLIPKGAIIVNTGSLGYQLGEVRLDDVNFNVCFDLANPLSDPIIEGGITNMYSLVVGWERLSWLESIRPSENCRSPFHLGTG